MTSIDLPRRSADRHTNDRSSLTNDDVASTAMSPSPHRFDINKPFFCTDKNLKRIDKIDLYFREVMLVGRDAKNHDNPKAMKNFINNHVGEKHGFVVSFLGSSVKCMNANKPNHEVKKREKR